MTEKPDVHNVHIEDHQSDEGAELGRNKTVDTIHLDEAVKVIGIHNHPQDWTDDEERKLVRKIDWKLMPLLITTYGIQFYDKAMLSHAALFGIIQDLGLSKGNRYSFSSSIFYLGYISGALPAMLLAQRFPIPWVASGVISAWGICLICTIFCHNLEGLFAQRFFLGFLESGISPMAMIIVSSFYKKQEQPLRQGAWLSASGFVTIIAPLINYGLGHINGSLRQWKYMYIVAGSVTVLWAVVIFMFLPSDPVQAKGLTERERYIAVARLRSNNTGVRNRHFKAAQALEPFYDLRFILAVLLTFCIFVTNGPLTTFAPLIIRGFGFNQFSSLLLTLPTGVVAGCTNLGSAWMATKFGGRRWHTWLICAWQIPGLVAAVLLWQLSRTSKGANLFALYLLAAFASPYSILLGLQTSNTAGYTKKTVTASVLFIGYCLGNFTGPLLFKVSDAPGYNAGFLGVTITSCIAFVLALLYRFVCIAENKRRDKTGIAESFDHAFEDDLTDMKNPQFRYVY